MEEGHPMEKKAACFSMGCPHMGTRLDFIRRCVLFVEEQRSEDPAGKGDGSEGAYVDRVPQYGNMVSASVPYALCEAIREGRVRRGDLLLLMGTAAGLTVNFMLLRY